MTLLIFMKYSDGKWYPAPKGRKESSPGREPGVGSK